MQTCQNKNGSAAGAASGIGRFAALRFSMEEASRFCTDMREKTAPVRAGDPA